MSDQKFYRTESRKYRQKPKQLRSSAPTTTVDPPKRLTGVRASLGTPIPRGERREMFAPQALSTKETPPRDDPMFQHSMLVQGLNALQPVSEVREHFLDYSQYLTIIRATHNSIANGDKNFKRNISLSMFEYYGVLLLWKRIFYLKNELRNFSPQVDGFGPMFPRVAIPKEIGYYLEGVGNITDFNGLTSFLSTLQDLDETVVGDTHVCGSFGRITKDNHFMYETTPSPFVFLSRIAQDVIYTRRVNSRFRSPSPKWDLDKNIRPVGRLIPNENLLGWRKAAILTPEQLGILDALIDVNASTGRWSYLPAETVNVGGLSFIRNIVVAVSEHLVNARSNIHNDYALGLTFKGSMAQEKYAERVSSDVSPNLLVFRPVSIRLARMCCYHFDSVHAVSYAAVFRYRFKRKGMIGSVESPDCLCYSTRDGKAPDGWLTTADEVFDSTSRWNDHNFQSLESDGMVVASEFSRNLRGVPAHGIAE
nr:MAG: putative capsid protein [Partitiviridae sp.]